MTPASDRRQLLELIDAGRSLPSACYADPSFFERERDTVLRRSWHYAAHTGQLAHDGDQLPCTVAGVPLVLVREGRIRGFVNICRHRGHTVVIEPTNRRSMQCPYHGWTYGLDGCLCAAPRSAAEPDFDATGLCLVPVQTAVWGPTVWVNLDADAPSFEDWIGGLPELVLSHGMDVTRHVYAFEREWPIRANWKVFLENAIECYHCPTCHPALARVLEMDPKLHELSVGGRYWIWTRIPFRRREGERRRVYDFHWIHPTTYFQHAGASGFDIGTVDVRAVDRIVFRHLVFLPADMDPDEVAQRRLLLDADPTIPEDVAICERVQAGHDAAVAPPGTLLPQSEWLVQHFQRVLVDMVYPTAAEGRPQECQRQAPRRD